MHGTKTVGLSLVGAALLSVGMLLAQQHPMKNVGARHPNLAEAQHLVAQAYTKIEAAQKANEFDMSGHAQKAKELLEEASKELKEAAETANKHK